jgi:hypothetical protein
MDVKSVRYAANPVLEVFVAKVNQQTSVSLRESSAHRMIQRLDFGGFILLPLEVLNHYAAAVVRKVRKHPQEMGCIREDELLAGDLDYQDFKRCHARIFCGGIRSLDYRTIRNSANARPSSCASREKRIWREKWKSGCNKHAK